MVVIYEGQYLARAAANDGSITPDMRLIYLEPTIYLEPHLGRPHGRRQARRRLPLHRPGAAQPDHRVRVPDVRYAGFRRLLQEPQRAGSDQPHRRDRATELRGARGDDHAHRRPLQRAGPAALRHRISVQANDPRSTTVTDSSLNIGSAAGAPAAVSGATAPQPDAAASDAAAPSTTTATLTLEPPVRRHRHRPRGRGRRRADRPRRRRQARLDGQELSRRDHDARRPHRRVHAEGPRHREPGRQRHSLVGQRLQSPAPEAGRVDGPDRHQRGVVGLEVAAQPSTAG